MQTILLYISNLSAVGAVWIGRRQKSLIWLYALSSLVFDLNGFILKILGVERRWASNLFFLIEFILISLFFIQNVFPERFKKGMIAFISIVSVGFIVHTCINSIWKSNYIGAAVFYSLYIFYCLSGFYKVITEVEFVMIEENPLFVFCIAFLLYASGIFVIFLFENKVILVDKEFNNQIWRLVHNPLNITKNLLIAYGFWLVKKNR